MRRRTARRLAVALGILLVLGIAARLALDPIATWRTRKVLAGLEGMRGTFSDVEIRLLALSYVIHHLRIVKLGAGGEALPYLEVERAELGVYGKELLRGHLVAGVELRRPKLNLLVGKARERTQAAKEAPEAGRGLEALAPFRIDRAEVKDGELLWVDGREPEKPRLWFHGIEATLENFATRAALARREPTVLAARATLQRSGTVSVFATADPLAKQLTFAGQGAVTGLRLAELGELLDAKTDLVPERGTLDLYVRFRAEDGRLSGGVRPLVKDAALKAGAPDLGTRLEAMLADASLHLFSDERGGKEVVATTIPIEGRVKGPQVQAVPTILGVLRNAFVRGLAGGLSGLPPPKAKEKQGTLEQARRALSPGHGPPRAQPKKGARR
ncbi:DUF748 domain-containing protein [Anaeromyxobacter sp. PSR-1]|uniref:DUF748 domain-containing protein n=1 Tax=unclassified Anaeromyxobacter TaxID=2620896 RepID=UPI0005EA48E1|nr:DUF748 domain-containing protein [Anaeromyxobacter sp. PSR-1]GAO04046.1 hypothetical protein PSR1_02934 [Anaeromyxobacter sp. PSR-1]